MEAIIERGGQKINMAYHPSQLKDMVTALVIVLLGRDKFVSPQCAGEKLELIREMCNELFSAIDIPSVKKEWSLTKRRITSHRKILLKMRPGVSIQSFIWNFIAGLDGNPNLPGFGFCQMPFKDRLRGNAETMSLYELDKRLDT